MIFVFMIATLACIYNGNLSVLLRFQAADFFCIYTGISV